MTLKNPTSVLQDIWDKKSERDKQIRVGASNLSNPCTRCVAEDLAGNAQPQGWATMGAKIGTAVHMYMEQEEPEDWLKEHRLTLGTIEGYGEVHSTTDAYIPETSTVWDTKTTTRDKLKDIRYVFQVSDGEHDSDKQKQARYKVEGYLNQVHLYAMGVVKSGLPVEDVVLAFIPRDAVTLSDLWAKSVPYQPKRAVLVWERAEKIWKAIEGGKELDTFKSHPLCYTCNVLREEEAEQ